jgi:hypothetical protein
MSFTFYDGTVAMVQGILATLVHILKKAEEQKPDTGGLVTARLHPDMLPLADQIRIIAMFSDMLAARLSGREPTEFTETMTSFAMFHERIATVQKTLEGLDKAAVDAQADVVAPTPMGSELKIDMTTSRYAHVLVLPNLYFHLSTAYGILRKESVELGKRDYYAGIFTFPEMK